MMGLKGQRKMANRVLVCPCSSLMGGGNVGSACHLPGGRQCTLLLLEEGLVTMVRTGLLEIKAYSHLLSVAQA